MIIRGRKGPFVAEPAPISRWWLALPLLLLALIARARNRRRP